MKTKLLRSNVNATLCMITNHVSESSALGHQVRQRHISFQRLKYLENTEQLISKCQTHLPFNGNNYICIENESLQEHSHF